MRVKLTYECKDYEFDANTDIIKKYEPLCTLVYLNKDIPSDEDTFTTTIDKADKWIVRLLKLLCVTYFANEADNRLEKFFKGVLDKVLKPLNKLRAHQYIFYEQSDLEWLLRECEDIQRALNGFWGLSHVAFTVLPARVSSEMTLEEFDAGQHVFGVCLQLRHTLLQTSEQQSLNFVLNTHTDLVKVSEEYSIEFFKVNKERSQDNQVLQTLSAMSCARLLDEQRPKRKIENMDKLMNLVSFAHLQNDSVVCDVWSEFFPVIVTWLEQRHTTRENEKAFLQTLEDFFKEVSGSAQTQLERKALLDALMMCNFWYVSPYVTFLAGRVVSSYRSAKFGEIIETALFEQVFVRATDNCSDEYLHRFLKRNARLMAEHATATKRENIQASFGQ